MIKYTIENKKNSYVHVSRKKLIRCEKSNLKREMPTFEDLFVQSAHLMYFTYFDKQDTSNREHLLYIMTYVGMYESLPDYQPAS
jgi:hypothetical protein